MLDFRLHCSFLLQRVLLEAMNICACKAAHDQYGMEHFCNARMEESRRLSKLKDLQPQAMSDMTAGVLVSSHYFVPPLSGQSISL